jgi:hypothetical protein
MIPKEWPVIGIKAHAVHYCLKVNVEHPLARWMGYLPFCGCNVNMEYFVPVLTVEIVGKVQSGMFPAKRESLLEMNVFKFVHLCCLKA